jgi:hypothetical protein
MSQDNGSKTWRFFSHFNRVNMQRGNPNVWTVHFRGACIQGTEVVFNVPTYTTFKPNGRQPRAKVVGRAHFVERSSGGTILVG